MTVSTYATHAYTSLLSSLIAVCHYIHRKSLFYVFYVSASLHLHAKFAQPCIVLVLGIRPISNCVWSPCSQSSTTAVRVMSTSDDNCPNLYVVL